MVSMSAGTLTRPESEVVSFSNAIFCMDCETLSTSRTDQCPVCQGHSLVSLVRMIGGSLLGQKLHRLRGPAEVLFEVTLTIRMHQTRAEDLSATLEGLTNIINPQLGRGQASFHVNVEPEAEAGFTA